jgi:Spy/CpxP family protein refolding chaperone
MNRIFLAAACVLLVILGAIADKEYADHGHDHHHHHGHDGRKLIDTKSLFLVY